MQDFLLWIRKSLGHQILLQNGKGSKTEAETKQNKKFLHFRAIETAEMHHFCFG